MLCRTLRPSHISKLGSNDDRQDLKSLWRKTLEEFHFLSAQERSSSFAVIILGVVAEEEVTCSGNIGPPSAGSEVCVCVCGVGGSGNITLIHGNIILPCCTFKIRIRSNKFHIPSAKAIPVCLFVWPLGAQSEASLCFLTLCVTATPTTLNNLNPSPSKRPPPPLSDWKRQPFGWPRLFQQPQRYCSSSKLLNAPVKPYRPSSSAA